MTDPRQGNIGKGGVTLNIPGQKIPVSAPAQPSTPAPTSQAEATKLSVADFTILAITKLRKDGKGGIHTVFSSFNKAFEKYFGFEAGHMEAIKDAKGNIVRDDKGAPKMEYVGPVADLVKQGVIESRPAKVWVDPKTGRRVGGATLYLKGEEPTTKRVDDCLATILSK